jgi:hypothetical protein
MLDFISYDPNEMEAEKRLLINLSVIGLLFRNLIIISLGIGHLSNDVRLSHVINNSQ